MSTDILPKTRRQSQIWRGLCAESGGRPGTGSPPVRAPARAGHTRSGLGQQRAGGGGNAQGHFRNRRPPSRRRAGGAGRASHRGTHPCPSGHGFAEHGDAMAGNLVAALGRATAGASAWAGSRDPPANVATLAQQSLIQPLLALPETLQSMLGEKTSSNPSAVKKRRLARIAKR